MITIHVSYVWNVMHLYVSNICRNMWMYVLITNLLLLMLMLVLVVDRFRLKKKQDSSYNETSSNVCQ